MTVAIPGDQVQFVMHCLRVAAVQFATDAQSIPVQGAPGFDRLRDGFLAQAKRANDLADKIEERS